jgi:hypothetical protein
MYVGTFVHDFLYPCCIKKGNRIHGAQIDMCTNHKAGNPMDVEE